MKIYMAAIHPPKLLTIKSEVLLSFYDIYIYPLFHSEKKLLNT